MVEGPLLMRWMDEIGRRRRRCNLKLRRVPFDLPAQQYGVRQVPLTRSGWPNEIEFVPGSVGVARAATEAANAPGAAKIEKQKRIGRGWYSGNPEINNPKKHTSKRKQRKTRPAPADLRRLPTVQCRSSPL